MKELTDREIKNTRGRGSKVSKPHVSSCTCTISEWHIMNYTCTCTCTLVLLVQCNRTRQ